MNDDGPLASGPSYPLGLKLLATLGMGMLLLWAWRSLPLMAQTTLPREGVVFLLLAGALVLGGYLSVMLSRTGIGATALTEGWLWQTRVPLADVAQVKFLRLRWLDTVFAPRLVVRVKARGTITFHAADARVLHLMELFVRGEAPPAAAPPSGP